MKSLLSPKGDWTDHAFRLGRMRRRGVKNSPTDLHEGRLASQSSLINIFCGSGEMMQDVCDDGSFHQQETSRSLAHESYALIQ
jgi:hypothetical protein